MIFEALLFCWLALFSLQAWFAAKGLAELRGEIRRLWLRDVCDRCPYKELALKRRRAAETPTTAPSELLLPSTTEEGSKSID